MQELRCLFALMVGSTRRFVDPSAAVELLRDAFRTNEAQQVQDMYSICFFKEQPNSAPAFNTLWLADKAEVLLSQIQ